jgi:hypothetical protein
VTRTKPFASDFDLFAQVIQGHWTNTPSLTHLGAMGSFWEAIIGQMLEVDPKKRPSAHVLHREFVSKRTRSGNVVELVATPPRPRSADEGIEDYLKSRCPELISKTEAERRIATASEAKDTTAGDETCLCRYKIGRGGSGFVFEVKYLSDILTLNRCKINTQEMYVLLVLHGIDALILGLCSKNHQSRPQESRER